MIESQSAPGADRVAVAAGAGGQTGRAVLREPAACGGRAVTADRVPGAWDGERITPPVVDQLAPAAVRNWAGKVAAEQGRVYGLVHLASGWRDGGSSADTDPAGSAFLVDLVVRTPRHSTPAFSEPLRDALDGRRSVTASQPTGVQGRHGDLDALAR
jgi:NAD(P)-dependent dehydrogenase (short-subunit alcohol dehydrogenase family)